MARSSSSTANAGGTNVTGGKVGSFVYGEEVIRFQRRNRPGNGTGVRIKVQPDCRVVVLAPERAGDDEVLEAVKKRGRWIYQHLRNFRARFEHVILPAYMSGESHYYLGRQYQLKVHADPVASPAVRRLRGRLEITCRSKDGEQVKALLEHWYKARAKEVFALRLESLLQYTPWVTAHPPLQLRAMKTQWGSCSPRGRLTLNPHLVKAPQDCIDYVIVHELCHLAEHNHSPRFYRLLKQVMPEWETVKMRLDGMAIRLLNGA